MVNVWSHSTIAPKPSSPAPGFYVMGGSRRLMQYVSRHSPEKVFLHRFFGLQRLSERRGGGAGDRLPDPAFAGQARHDDAAESRHGAAAAIAECAARADRCSGHALMAEQPDAVLDALYAVSQMGKRKTTPR